MAKRDLNLVLATTEIVPFSKVGGLADVMGALPDELEKLGAAASVFTPLYSSIDRAAYGIKPEAGLPTIEVRIAGALERFRLYSCLKPRTGVRVYFLDNDRFYARKGIYTVPDTGKAFPDEDERTIFFNRAVLAAVKALDLHPDIIHCNDFHAGLIPAYLKIDLQNDPHFAGAATVFSIHNLAYQGLFGPEFMQKAGFKSSLFSPMSPFEFWGRVNMMKVGIAYSDIISTVSRTYAEEITSTEEFGCGLEGVLRSRKADLVGILNGIDMDVWDPSKDALLPYPFTTSALAGKGQNRAELLKAFALPQTGAGPVIGMISRLVDQKGFDILADAFDQLMALGVNLVVLGTGQEKYHELYWSLAKKYPRQFGLKLEFNDRLAHLIEGGAISSSCRRGTSRAASTRCTACGTGRFRSCAEPAACSIRFPRSTERGSPGTGSFSGSIPRPRSSTRRGGRSSSTGTKTRFGRFAAASCARIIRGGARRKNTASSTSARGASPEWG